MMKIPVFAAAGSLSSHFVQQTLKKGRLDDAFTFIAEKMKHNESTCLILVHGDGEKFLYFENTMKGLDVLFCALATELKDNFVLQAPETTQFETNKQYMNEKSFF